MNKSMTRHMALMISFVLIPCFACSAWAQEKRWKDDAALSYVQTGGNTDVMTFSANNTITYNFSKAWSGSWKIAALSGKTDGVKTAERYTTDLRTDYSKSDAIYYYAQGGWLQDKFAGIDNRLYIGPGAGYKILTGGRNILSAEAGLNYAKETYPDGTSSDFLEGRAFGKYEFIFNPKTKFTQTIEYLHNFHRAAKFRINSVTGLTTKLTDIFSLKVSYELNYQNRPSPVTLDKTDTIFSVALAVSF